MYFFQYNLSSTNLTCRNMLEHTFSTPVTSFIEVVGLVVVDSSFLRQL